METAGTVQVRINSTTQDQARRFPAARQPCVCRALQHAARSFHQMLGSSKLAREGQQQSSSEDILSQLTSRGKKSSSPFSSAVKLTLTGVLVPAFPAIHISGPEDAPATGHQHPHGTPRWLHWKGSLQHPPAEPAVPLVMEATTKSGSLKAAACGAGPNSFHSRRAPEGICLVCSQLPAHQLRSGGGLCSANHTVVGVVTMFIGCFRCQKTLITPWCSATA